MVSSLRLDSRDIQKLRWKVRLATGFDPAAVSIPKRFTEITTWKGKVDGQYLSNLKLAYAEMIRALASG